MISAAIEAARTVGAIRSDATVDDLIILLTGCATRLHQALITDPSTWQHYATLTRGALQPDPDPPE